MRRQARLQARLQVPPQALGEDPQAEARAVEPVRPHSEWQAEAPASAAERWRQRAAARGPVSARLGRRAGE